MARMRPLLRPLFLLMLIGGGMKLTGAQVPILDYPHGGQMAQPRIEVQQPRPEPAVSRRAA